jgi:hypothetical protein
MAGRVTGVVIAELGQCGVTYAAERLVESGDTLSLLLAARRKGQGTAAGILPSIRPENSELDLRAPGTLKSPELCDQAIQTVTKLIRQFLSENPEGICVMETWLSGSDAPVMLPGWPWAAYSPTSYGTWDGMKGTPHGTGALIFLTNTEIASASDETLQSFVNGPARPGIVVLSRCALESRTAWSSEFLTLVADNANHVIVPAFGVESFVIWSPS